MNGKIYQINIKHEVLGERGLPKKPVKAVIVTSKGALGDYNRYRSEKMNNDPDKALLIMPLETIHQLNSEGWPILPGDLGENITTFGIPYDYFKPNQKYKLGDAEIEISELCKPCNNLYLLPYVGKEKLPQFLRTMSGRRGWYARVLRPQVIFTGESIEEIL